ncbi:MAG: DUF2846 domain-containing protein [Bacteroidetes bacterium]|nr:DUF2846 domain-containing protein [Fibrella sp.]
MNNATMNRTSTCLTTALWLSLTAFRHAPTPPVPAPPATVYIYRGGEFFAGGLNYSIFANGEKICKLSNSRYLTYQAPPGTVRLTAQRGGVEVFKRETELTLPVESGKRYYVRCDVKSSVMRTRLEMAEVTETTGRRDLETLKPDNCQQASSRP